MSTRTRGRVTVPLFLVLAAGSTSFAEPPPSAERTRASEGTLDRDALIRDILASNPSVAAAREAIVAARARVRLVTALDDPRLSYSVAPISLFDSTAPDGHVVKLEQTLPFPGKRGLAGERAEGEAGAAEAELEQTRLELALMGARLYAQWFSVHRALAINGEHTALVKEMKQSAQVQFTAGRASQQDPLQAEFELAHLEHEHVVLESERDLVRAELNGLLHRQLDAPVAPPPDSLDVPNDAPSSSAPLMAIAVKQRPDLAALRAREGGAEAAIALADRQYWPDLMVMAEYNSMWDMPAQRWMVGVGVDLPVFLDKRRAGVDEARAMRARLEHEEERRLDDVRTDVERARLQLVEALHVVHLYLTRLLPVAQDQVAAARAGFVVGNTPFVALVEAEKNLRSVQLASAQAHADAQLRKAELDVATGVIPTLTSSEEGAHE